MKHVGIGYTLGIVFIFLYLLAGCQSVGISSYFNKAKTAISGTLGKYNVDVEKTGADEPPFNDPA